MAARRVEPCHNISRVLQCRHSRTHPARRGAVGGCVGVANLALTHVRDSPILA